MGGGVPQGDPRTERVDPGEGHDLPARDPGLVVLIGHPVDVEHPHLVWSQTPVRCLDALGAAVSLGASRIRLLIGALVASFVIVPPSIPATSCGAALRSRRRWLACNLQAMDNPPNGGADAAGVRRLPSLDLEILSLSG